MRTNMIQSENCSSPSYRILQCSGWVHRTASWLWCEVRWLFVTWLIVMDYLRSGLCSDRSWEHGQQSRSLRQSTKSSVLNLNVRALIWRQNVFLSGDPALSPALLPTCSPLSTVNRPIDHCGLASPPPSCVAPCLALLTWTMAPLPLSCSKERLDNSHWLFLNFPAVRITSSVWCFKVPLIPLGQASPTLAGFSFFKPPPPFFFRAREYSVLLELAVQLKKNKAELCRGVLVLSRHPSRAEFITLHWSHFAKEKMFATIKPSVWSIVWTFSPPVAIKPDLHHIHL